MGSCRRKYIMKYIIISYVQVRTRADHTSCSALWMETVRGISKSRKASFPYKVHEKPKNRPRGQWQSSPKGLFVTVLSATDTISFKPYYCTHQCLALIFDSRSSKWRVYELLRTNYCSCRTRSYSYSSRAKANKSVDVRYYYYVVLLSDFLSHSIEDGTMYYYRHPLIIIGDIDISFIIAYQWLSFKIEFWGILYVFLFLKWINVNCQQSWGGTRISPPRCSRIRNQFTFTMCGNKESDLKVKKE